MTDKTQPTAHAEITAPISADLRGMLGLSEQDAGLLEQAASMLDGLQNDERNRGNCSTAEGAACSADAVRRLAVQLLRSTETAQCLHQGAEPDKHMTIGRALREGLRAEPWISGGPGAAACVGLCAIQLQGWWHTAETAKAYADAYNRGADDMRAALQAAPPAPAAVAMPDERDAYIHWLTSKHPDVYTTGDAMHWWGHGHVSALAWQARAALAAAPAQAVAVPEGVSVDAWRKGAHFALEAVSKVDSICWLTDSMKEICIKQAAEAVIAERDRTAAAPAQEDATQLTGQGAEVIENLLRLAQIVDRAVEDWGESFPDGSCDVKFHKDEAVKMEAILEFFDSLPDAPEDEGVIESGPLKAARAIRAAAPAQAQEDARDTDALKASRDTGINHGVCLALQIMHAAGDAGGTQWDELLSVAGRDEMESYAKHVEPDEWELCGFGQVERREAEIQAIGAAQGGATP